MGDIVDASTSASTSGQSLERPENLDIVKNTMIIAVDGNIASGKSTVLSSLTGSHDVVMEPVERWTLLDKFYEDRRKYALAFNLEVLASFHAIAGRPGLTITERSPVTNRDVFARTLANEGVMTGAEWDLYKRYFDVLGWRPDAIIFIDVPAATCFERMQSRGRACERPVDLEYLERLERAYDTLLRFVDVPVVRVDGTKTPDEIYAAVKAAIDETASKSDRRSACVNVN